MLLSSRSHQSSGHWQEQGGAIGELRQAVGRQIVAPVAHHVAAANGTKVEVLLVEGVAVEVSVRQSFDLKIADFVKKLLSLFTRRSRELFDASYR